MKVICTDASDYHGTGKGLLTEGKRYQVYGQLGDYYEIRCDNGKMRTKAKARFKLCPSR